MEKRVRTRIAPSPTGDPHVGTAYIALYNLAFAWKNGGDFILRIEDTDQNRYVEGSEKMIFDALKWLGLDYAEGPDVGGPCGPYRQSERIQIYAEYAKKLVELGGAYYCFCTPDRLERLRERQKAMGKAPGYDGCCRSLTPEQVKAKLDAGEPYVIRLKMPYEGQTVIHDRLRGDIVFENDKIDDQVLLKADGYPTYHLANVVDDHLMGITHVIRAEEWIASTPKHIQLYKAYGWDMPEFIHMPLLRNSDKSKISKRKNPVSLVWYREEGYLKEGIVNFLGLMGYSFGENKEIFFLEDFKENFNIDNVSLGGPVFDLVKLGWVNNQHMRMKDLDELTRLTVPFFREVGYVGENVGETEFATLRKVVAILREGAPTLKALVQNARQFFDDEISLQEASEDMNSKQKKSVEKLRNSILDEIGKASIALFLEKLKNWPRDGFTVEEARDILHATWEEVNTDSAGKVFMPLRAAITGQSIGTDLYNILYVIGRDRAVARMERMIRNYHIL